MLKQTLFATLVALSGAAAGAPEIPDVTEPVILVAKPELRDRLYGASILVVRPLGDGHVGFIVNRPTDTRLPSNETQPIYLGGPAGSDLVFALVQRADSPGGKSLAVMPGLYLALESAIVDRLVESEAEHTRFIAGLVAWRPGELRAEIESGAWYVLAPDAALAMRKPEGLWEELVLREKQASNTI